MNNEQAKLTPQDVINEVDRMFPSQYINVSFQTMHDFDRHYRWGHDASVVTSRLESKWRLYIDLTGTKLVVAEGALHQSISWNGQDLESCLAQYREWVKTSVMLDYFGVPRNV